MKIDAEAALRCWAVELNLGGAHHRIEPRPAAEWIMAAVAQDWMAIVPGWLTDSRPVDDAFLDGTITYQELVDAAHDALTVAAGIPWYAAVRLLLAALDEPAAMGPLLMAVDPATAPLGAVVTCLYHIFTRGGDAQHRARLDAELTKPPAGVPAAQRYDQQAAAAEFERAFAARGGAPRTGG